MIAFIGSVFSPWYYLARRGGRVVAAENHCSMNVSLYGRPRRWAMTEYGETRLERAPDHLRINRSALDWDGSALTVRLDEVTSPWPGRMRGTIKLRPEALAEREVALDGTGRHRWSPIAPAARVEVALTAPAICWAGHAYFDTNDGDAPLEQDFARWDWCRAPLSDGVAVLYHGEGRDGRAFCHALRYDQDGRAADLAAPPEAALGRTRWGMPMGTLADAGAAPRVVQRLEDAPFYARSVIASRVCGQEVTAVHETLSLDRFATPWVQAMLPFKAPRALW